MLQVGSDKSTLFVRGGVVGRIDRPGSLRMVIIIAPLCEMVGKFVAWEVSTSIFKVNDDKLFVFVFRVQQR